MKKILSLVILAAMLGLGASSARADGPYPTSIGGPTGVVTPNDNTGEIEIYQAINSLLGTSYTSNAEVDPFEYTGNTSVWQNDGNGGYTVIGLGAGATNTLDVYNVATPGVLLSPLSPGFTGDKLIGNGTSGDPYMGAPSVFSPGTQFGFDLNSDYNGVMTNWRSNPALNSDLMDHLVVYNLSATDLNGRTVYVELPGSSSPTQVTLKNPYFIGFEDTPIGNSTNGSPSDLDYNDLMVLVSGVGPNSHADPVPEPMTLALLATGLIGIAFFNRYRLLHL